MFFLIFRSLLAWDDPIDSLLLVNFVSPVPDLIPVTAFFSVFGRLEPKLIEEDFYSLYGPTSLEGVFYSSYFVSPVVP